MYRIRTLAVLVAVLALALVVSPAPAAAKAGKGHHVHGVVTMVDGKTITVKTGGHKNKKTGETTPVEEKTFTVTATTTFVKMTGTKGAETPTTVTINEVKAGMHVSVAATDGVATEVKIGHHHHHGKKKPAA